MNSQEPSEQRLIDELRQRIAELEKASRENEDRYRKLSESTTDMIYIADRNGDILYANSSAAAAMRCDVNSIVGKRQKDLFPPDMAQRHTASIAKVFETGETLDADGVYHFGPAEICLNTRLMPLRDNTGQITSVMGVSRNITARKRAEAALEKARDELERRVEERTAELVKANQQLVIFRRFVEASRQGFAMAKLDGEITYVNPAISRLLADGTHEDIIGKHVSTIYSEEYMQRRENEILPSILRDGYWEGEVAISYQGGSILTLQNCLLVRDEQGDPAYLATVLTDITERKRADEALRQSHDELRAIYDGMVDGLLVTDMETMRFLRTNASICRMLGYSETELLSLSVRDIHPAEALPHIMEHIRSVDEASQTPTGDIPFLRKNGSVFHAEVIGTFLIYNGRPCSMGIFRDITERKRAEEALRREHRTLKHLLQSSDHERQVIAYEIHDGLAQQLAGAIMQFQTYAHHKKTRPKDAAKAFDAAMTMLSQGHSEARRLISGVRPPILDESGVATAIAHLVNEERRRKGPNIELHSEVGFDRLAPIMENAIYRIVQEGLTNACTHSKSERVRVELVQHGDDLRIRIQDWGTGFAPGDYEEERFGLAGIRERARLLGGNTTVESALGQGTCITVELPLAPRD